MKNNQIYNKIIFTNKYIKSVTQKVILYMSKFPQQSTRGQNACNGMIPMPISTSTKGNVGITVVCTFMHIHKCIYTYTYSVHTIVYVYYYTYHTYWRGCIGQHKNNLLVTTRSLPPLAGCTWISIWAMIIT